MRYSVILLIVLGSAATALAAVSPHEATAIEAPGLNVTIVEKNQAFPLVGPFIVEDCRDEACSETLG